MLWQGGEVQEGEIPINYAWELQEFPLFCPSWFQSNKASSHASVEYHEEMERYNKVHQNLKLKVNCDRTLLN